MQIELNKLIIPASDEFLSMLQEFNDNAQDDHHNLLAGEEESEVDIALYQIAACTQLCSRTTEDVEVADELFIQGMEFVIRLFNSNQKAISVQTTDRRGTEWNHYIVIKNTEDEQQAIELLVKALCKYSSMYDDTSLLTHPYALVRKIGEKCKQLREESSEERERERVVKKKKKKKR